MAELPNPPWEASPEGELPPWQRELEKVRVDLETRGRMTFKSDVRQYLYALEAAQKHMRLAALYADPARTQHVWMLSKEIELLQVEITPEQDSDISE